MKRSHFFSLLVIMALVASLLLVVTGAQAQTSLPTASQVAAQLGVGYNIGNTLEAQCGETAWGNPMITQQFVNSVKAAGFNSIRLPAAWDCHASNNTIDSAWLARVKQVVDYAISQNMYVIINIHWDGGWLEEHPLYSYQTAVNQKQNAYWTQIANYFKTYNEHLLFAGTNEVHADYGEPTTEHITVQESYNQTFVNAVRATGGNNSTRTLVVQTYNTNMWHGLHYFTMPTDSASSRLIVETHYYDPYDYTLNPSGPCMAWGAPYTQYSQCSWAQEAYVDDLFNQVKAKWVDQGIPVIIGEYGVVARSGLDLSSRQYWLTYINNAAYSRGMKTFYWDNGVANEFSLFDRNSGSVVDQGALNAIMAGAGGGGGPTPTRTNTPPAGPTNTPTRTNTPQPTNTPGQGGGSTTYQAESAVVGGGNTIDTNHTGYNGSGFVNFSTSGGYVEFQNVSGTGSAQTIQFRNALGATSSRTGQLVVNGATQNITFSPTGSWDTWTTLDVTVTLNAGTNNTIRLQSNGQDLANQDEMTVVGGGSNPTNTPVVNTPTRTNTPAPTNTPPPGPTQTPTRTNTPPAAPTATPTSGGGGGGTCSPVTSTITAPFTYDGAGTFCWQSSNLGSYINNWNMTSLAVNGVDYTGVWVATSSLPAKINGYWYVAYNGPYAWSHFEAK